MVSGPCFRIPKSRRRSENLLFRFKNTQKSTKSTRFETSGCKSTTKSARTAQWEQNMIISMNYLIHSVYFYVLVKSVSHSTFSTGIEADIFNSWAYYQITPADGLGASWCIPKEHQATNPAHDDRDHEPNLPAPRRDWGGLPPETLQSHKRMQNEFGFRAQEGSDSFETCFLVNKDRVSMFHGGDIWTNLVWVFRPNR